MDLDIWFFKKDCYSPGHIYDKSVNNFSYDIYPYFP